MCTGEKLLGCLSRGDGLSMDGGQVCWGCGGKGAVLLYLCSACGFKFSLWLCLEACSGKGMFGQG